MYFVPKGSCLTKRGIEMSEKNGVEGECEDDELRKEAEGAVGAIELPDIGSATNEELEEFVTKVLRCVASLKSVKIDRAHFLRSELKRRCPEINAELAIEKTPIEAGISPQELDRIAAEVIDFETKKCSALSFLAGLPGGVAIAGSITADAAQYFAHVMRIEQKLAYLYGWQSFLDKENEVDDETVGLLIAFLGVVLNVTGVAGTITKITAGVAVDGVAAAIKKQTLTKLPWWKPAKQVIKVLTQKTMTKEVFANAVAKKAVPVAGAFISGGLTYASFKPGAERLRKHLRSLPVSGIDKSEVDGATKNVVDEAVENASKAVCSAGAAAVSAGEQAGKALADGVAAVGGVVGKGAQAAGGVLEEGAKVAGGALEGGLRVAGKGLGDAAKGISGFFGSIGKK